MNSLKLDSPAENAFGQLQDTSLTPMEEILFKSWSTANEIDKPDKPGDNVDYRGIYKSTGGKVLPAGQLKQFATNANNEQTLMRVLQDRVKTEAEKAAQKVNDQVEKQFQKTEDLKQEAIKAKIAEPTPRQLRVHELENKGTELETKHTAVKNEGKKIDITKLVVKAKTDKDKPKEKAAKSGK